MPKPRGFDEDCVVEGAMELFWTKGYEGTSVADLATGLGIHPGSLYRVFGDKHALFLRALSRYREMQIGSLTSALLEGGHVLPRIRGVLVGLVEIAAQEAEPRGCLASNTTEIPAGLDLPGWAAALTMLVQGLQVVVNVDPGPRRLTRSVDVVLELLGEKHECYRN